jgi:hypothetical protein
VRRNECRGQGLPRGSAIRDLMNACRAFFQAVAGAVTAIFITGLRF